MDRLFNQQNVERYRNLVDVRTNQVQRGAILELLAREMDELKQTPRDWSGLP